MKIAANLDNTLPSVDFDEIAGILILSGRSIYNSPEKFYNELVDYIKLYFHLPKDLTLIMDIEYFSTKSSKCILNLFYACVRNIKKDEGATLKIYWKTDEDDEDMQDIITDYEDLIKHPIQLIYNSTD